MLEDLVELLLRHIQPVSFLKLPGARLKPEMFLLLWFRKTVVGACILANIAAKDSVVELSSNGIRNQPPVLDGVVGEAPVYFKLIGRIERSCGAGINTAGAFPTMISFWFINIQVECSEDDANKEKRSILFVDDDCMFPLPTDTTTLSPRFFQNRARIDEGP